MTVFIHKHDIKLHSTYNHFCIKHKLQYKLYLNLFYFNKFYITKDIYSPSQIIITNGINVTIPEVCRRSASQRVKILRIILLTILTILTARSIANCIYKYFYPYSFFKIQVSILRVEKERRSTQKFIPRQHPRSHTPTHTIPHRRGRRRDTRKHDRLSCGWHTKRESRKKPINRR